MIRIFKSRLLLAATLLFLLDVAGGLAILAPILVFLRNQLDKSASALQLWPQVAPVVVVDVLFNDLQALAVFAASAMVIYLLYFFLRTFFVGGIYHLVVFRDPADRRIDSSRSYISRCADAWPGFIKVALLAIAVYAVAFFLGIVFGRLLSGLPIFWRLCLLALFILLGSTYLQILRTKMTIENDCSLRNAIRATRRTIGESAVRLIGGNLSVAIAGILMALVLWSVNKGVRGHNWSLGLALISFLLQQAIVFIISLMQIVRVNFNQTIVRRGVSNALGRTELG